MGIINFFAQQQFGALFRPGEALEAMGIGIHFQGGQSYVVFGLTNQRLLVLEVPMDSWAQAPKAERKDLMLFELPQIVIRTEAGSNILGPLTRFIIGGPQGELVFVLRHDYNPFGNKWNFTGFDPTEHSDWNQFVVPWLVQHCATGTLRSPQAMSHAFNEVRAAKANRAAFMAHSAQLAAQAEAVRQANASIKWPYVVGGFGVLMALIGLLQCRDGVRFFGYASDFEDRVDQSVKTKTGLWADPKVAARARESIEDERARAAKALISGIVIFVIGAGAGGTGFYLGTSLNRKKRERLQQTGAPVAVPG